MRKLSLTLLALIVQLSAWAFDGDYYKYTISPSTGTANKTSGWLTSWVSTDKVGGTADANGLQMRSNAANFQKSGVFYKESEYSYEMYDMRSGTANTSTYTLTAPTGFKIASYTMTFKLVSSGNIIVDTQDGGDKYIATSEFQTIRRVRPNSKTTTIIISGANNGILVKNFEVEVVRDNSDYATLTTNVINTINRANEVYNSLSTTLETELITSSSQLSSPYTDNNHPLLNLISNSENDFWQTDGSNNVEADVHYLQVSLAEVTSGVDKLFVTMQRSKGQTYNHPTALRVKGYKVDDSNLTFAQGADLGRLTFDYTENGADKSKETIDATGYSYLRFYWEESNGGSENQNGYWHCGKFQLNNCRAYHRELIAKSTTSAMDYYLPLVSTTEIGDANMQTYLEELEDAISSFVNATENPVSKYKWILKDANSNFIYKSTTLIKQNGDNVRSPYTSNDFITVTNPSSFECNTTEGDRVIESTYTVKDGFPQFVLTLDQINEATWYNVNVRDKYVKFDSNSNTFYDEAANAPDASDKNGWFAFVGDPDTGFKIFNYGGACAFGSNDVRNDTRIKGVREDEAATYLFEKHIKADTKDEQWQVRDVRGEIAFLNQQTTNLGIWNHAGYDTGNKFVITEVSNADVAKYLVTVDITATDASGNNPITWRQDKFYTSTEPTVNTPATYPFIGSYSCSPTYATISADNRHFTFTAQHTMPFVEGKFYQIKTRAKDKYLQYIPAGSKNGNNYSEGVYTISTSSSNSADHLWYFKRKINTPDYYTLHAVAVDKGISGSSLTTTPTEYQLLKSNYSNAGNDGFMLANGNNTLGGHQIYTNYTTDWNSQLSHWGDGKSDSNINDKGNCFWVEEFDESIFEAYANGTFDDTPNLVGTYIGSTDNSTNVRNFLTNKTGANLRAALNNFQEQNTFSTISTDKYYQLVAKGDGGNTGRVMYSRAACGKTGGSDQYADRGLLIGDNVTIASIPASAFKFKKGDDGYKIEHVNSKYWLAQLSGKNDGDNPDLPISEYDSGTYLVEQVEGQLSTIWSFRDKDANTKYLHSGVTGNGNNILVRTQTPVDNKGCCWAIREITQVPVAVSTVNWATLCLPMAVTIPSEADLEVFYISEISPEGVLTLQKIDGGTTVAKETPMLLYSSAETLPKTYNFAVSTNAGTSYSATNKLSGSTARRTGFNTTSSEYYGLANKDAGVGFYPSTSATIAANKAYILASNVPPETPSARALVFNFDDNAETGISATQVAESLSDSQGIIYDMQGRRVQKMQRGGMYVINGTKVIVK